MAKSTPKIELYQSPLCPYCHLAKRLLKKRGLAFESINVALSASRRDEMIKRAKQTSVPQIFINDQHVGGYDQLAALDERGELVKLLESSN
ncbi:MAG TPA: glutaredoxin 3 [Halothiobacillaceae bacterium]|nr:glutaredoxin 3 [Halothiobacillaceae bacterium]